MCIHVRTEDWHATILMVTNCVSHESEGIFEAHNAVLVSKLKLGYGYILR